MRARDHNEKKRRIRALRQKAAERNPDEFAFGMMSSTTKGGVKITKRAVENGTAGPLSMDVAKLLKTQDAGYLQTVLQQARQEKEKVQKELILAETGVDTQEGRKGSRKSLEEVAVDGSARLSVAEVGSEDDMSDESEGDSDSGEGLSKEQLQARRRRKRTTTILRARLEGLEQRASDLTIALDGVEQQRSKMSNAVGGTNKNGTKFKVRERKR